MKPIFKGGVPKFLFFLLLLGAVVLLIADLDRSRTREIRQSISLLLTPIQWLVDMPTRIANDISDILVTRKSLVKENVKLRFEVLELDQQVQQTAALQEENKRLRELLKGKAKVANEVQLAELIGVNPDPFQHQVILDLGSEDGVFKNQPVLDAGGVFGQVVDTSIYTCRVMQITDSRHALPVEISRNGFRSIALGKGNDTELELDHVPDTADVRVGDLLVSSGLGGRFPQGYPVARITQVVRDPGRPFSIVKAKPTARLANSRHLLLVKPNAALRSSFANGLTAEQPQ